MRVIPVVVLDDSAAAAPLADAGLPCAEITLRTAAGEAAISIMAQRRNLLVGRARSSTPVRLNTPLRPAPGAGLDDIEEEPAKQRTGTGEPAVQPGQCGRRWTARSPISRRLFRSSACAPPTSSPPGSATTSTTRSGASCSTSSGPGRLATDSPRGMLGLSTRIGLEDVTVCRDGSTVVGNAELVRLALQIWTASRAP